MSRQVVMPSHGCALFECYYTTAKIAIGVQTNWLWLLMSGPSTITKNKAAFSWVHCIEFYVCG